MDEEQKTEEWWQRIQPKGMVWHKRGKFGGAANQIWALCGAWEWQDNTVITSDAPKFPALWCGDCWRIAHPSK